MSSMTRDSSFKRFSKVIVVYNNPQVIGRINKFSAIKLKSSKISSEEEMLDSKLYVA